MISSYLHRSVHLQGSVSAARIFGSLLFATSILSVNLALAETVYGHTLTCIDSESQSIWELEHDLDTPSDSDDPDFVGDEVENCEKLKRDCETLGMVSGLCHRIESTPASGDESPDYSMVMYIFS